MLKLLQHQILKKTDLDASKALATFFRIDNFPNSFIKFDYLAFSIQNHFEKKGLLSALEKSISKQLFKMKEVAYDPFCENLLNVAFFPIILKKAMSVHFTEKSSAPFFKMLEKFQLDLFFSIFAISRVSVVMRLSKIVLTPQDLEGLYCFFF